MPPPNVSVSSPNGTLYAGSTLNLTCSVTLLSEVDINVTVNITWYSGTTILKTTNLTTLPTTEATISDILSLSPLNAMDNNVTCSAKVSPTVMSPFVLDSPLQRAQEVILNILSKHTVHI